jgi:hypothetical protein
MSDTPDEDRMEELHDELGQVRREVEDEPQTEDPPRHDDVVEVEDDPRT